MKISKLFKVTSKSSIKPELQQLYLKDQKIYATDSFKAVIMNADTIATPDELGYISLAKTKAKEAELQALKLKMTVLPEIDNNGAQYPDIETIMPTDEALDTDYLKMSFNRQYIIDLLEAMQGGDAFDRVDLYINKTSEQKPAIFKNNNGTGLLMPLNK